MNITIEDVKQYKTELTSKEDHNTFAKMIYRVNKILPDIALNIIYLVLFLSIVLFPVLGPKIPIVSLCFILFTIVLTMANVFLMMFMESRQKINKLSKKMSKGIYKGSISSILDLECEITKAIIKPRKEEFLKLIFENKGIPGYLIVSLLNDVEFFRKKMEIEKQEEETLNKNKEEREALIAAGTPIGSLLKEVSEI